MCSSDLEPFVEAIRRNDAAAFLERAAEDGFLVHGFRAGIDEGFDDLATAGRPRRSDAPGRMLEASLVSCGVDE